MASKQSSLSGLFAGILLSMRDEYTIYLHHVRRNNYNKYLVKAQP